MGASYIHRKHWKQLPECEKLPIVAFESIAANEIDIDVSDLSTDQNYMLQVYRAISSGHCDDSLAHRNSGKMAHSRWLTGLEENLGGKKISIRFGASFQSARPQFQCSIIF